MSVGVVGGGCGGGGAGGGWAGVEVRNERGSGAVAEWGAGVRGLDCAG